MINGAPNNASDIAPSLSLNRFASDILVDLTAGDRISLQMYGIVAVATLLPKSVGASLSIVRLS